MTLEYQHVSRLVSLLYVANFRIQIELNDTWEEVKCTKKNVSH